MNEIREKRRRFSAKDGEDSDDERMFESDNDQAGKRAKFTASDDDDDDDDE